MRCLNVLYKAFLLFLLLNSSTRNQPATSRLPHVRLKADKTYRITLTADFASPTFSQAAAKSKTGFNQIKLCIKKYVNLNSQKNNKINSSFVCRESHKHIVLIKTKRAIDQITCK